MSTVVKIAQGTLRGLRVCKPTGTEYFSFQGLPYAKPPTGPLRFQPPQPAEPWSGVRDATREGAIAPQFHMLTLQYAGDEDCLFLNVYTSQLPSASSRQLRPVMVWIHGGGFMTGSGDSDAYGPDHLLEGGVVVVTINYRLGVLGFMSTGDSVVPGNMGLKDQVMALRWVKDNIAAFGGDPNNVTIFGESAGSRSCHSLMLSPMARGLFRRVILQSGVALNDGVQVAARTFRLAHHLGLRSENSRELLAFMSGIPARTLVETILEARSQEEVDQMLTFPFRPVVEPASAAEGAFLTLDPLEALRAGDFDRSAEVIIGVNSQEGLFGYKSLLDPAIQKKLEARFELTLPPDLRLRDHKHAIELGRVVNDFYLEGQPIGPNTMQRMIDLRTDTRYLHSSSRAARMQSALGQKVYFYHFDVNGRLNHFKKIMGGEEFPGACHVDELGYMFQWNALPVDIEPGSLEDRTRTAMVNLWTNFAKTGNPTPDGAQVTWPLFTEENGGAYLNVDNSGLSVRKGLQERRVAFWDRLYDYH